MYRIELYFLRVFRPRSICIYGLKSFLRVVGILSIQLELEILHLAAIDLLGHLRCPRADSLVGHVRKRRVGVVADCYGRDSSVGRIYTPLIEVSRFITLFEDRFAFLFNVYF